MMTRGQLVESGLKVMGKGNADTKKDVECVLNACYYRIAEMTDWLAMRVQESHTFTATETDGRYLRSDLIGITAVVDETDGEELRYHPIAESGRFAYDGKPHWYHPSVAVSPVDEIDSGISINRGDTNVSGTTKLSGNQSGEYVQFDNQPGFYKFSSTTAISTTYWGPSIKNKGCIVRPRSTKKLVITDADAALEAATVQVYGWVYPPPLYLDSQRPLLPQDRALELMMWIDLVGPLEKRRSEAQDYRIELYGRDEQGGGALDRMKAMNASQMQPIIPRNRLGNILKFGRIR